MMKRLALFGVALMTTVMAWGAPQQEDDKTRGTIQLTDKERLMVSRNNDFAFNLFGKLHGTENQLVSPLSITFALGLLNNGAAGQTQQEINSVLGFDNAADINAFCRKMLTESGQLDPKTKTLLASTIYVNKDYQLQAPFVKQANDYYDATPETRDFHDGQTLDVINQWASDHTEGLITNVLSEDEYDPTAVSYLLNALYFKGAWSTTFETEETRDEVFNNDATVPMMHNGKTEYTYAEDDLCQSIVLPYGNGAYQMTVFLPRKEKTIEDVLAKMNGQNWQVKGHRCLVDLKLPRFDTDVSNDLETVMAELGMPSAFDPSAAEFPYFCNTYIYISLMKQVAKIKVDEQGTEAAAVTVIGEKATAIPETVDFHADRPFLYIISEQSTGAIFFIGQFTNKTDGSRESSIDATPHPMTTGGRTLYNLKGQRLSTPPAKGLYIQEGRKHASF